MSIMVYDDEDCPRCAPMGCDCSDAKRPEALSDDYGPVGCHCGARYDGRDCMCFEDN